MLGAIAQKFVVRTLVEDFIDCLYQQNSDRMLTQSTAKLSEQALQKIWDNPDDAEYDQL
jgi:hypothetical protein